MRISSWIWHWTRRCPCNRASRVTYYKDTSLYVSQTRMISLRAAGHWSYDWVQQLIRGRWTAFCVIWPCHLQLRPLYPRPHHQLVERALRLHLLNLHTLIRSLQMVDVPVQVPLPFRASLKERRINLDVSVHRSIAPPGENNVLVVSVNSWFPMAPFWSMSLVDFARIISLP